MSSGLICLNNENNIFKTSKIYQTKKLQLSTFLKQKLEMLITYPYIGKINPTMNNNNIRDYSVFGYKVIYKINSKSVLILAIYKHIDFDEETLNKGD